MIQDWEKLFDEYEKVCATCEVTRPYMLFHKKGRKFWYGDNCIYVNFKPPITKDCCVVQMIDTSQLYMDTCDEIAIGYQGFGGEQKTSSIPIIEFD